MDMMATDESPSQISDKIKDMLFAKSADLSGAIITKLDGSSRGGVSLAVSAEVNLPIRFIGAGEGIKDLRPFNSFEFVEALLADR